MKDRDRNLRELEEAVRKVHVRSGGTDLALESSLIARCGAAWDLPETDVAQMVEELVGRGSLMRDGVGLRTRDFYQIMAKAVAEERHVKESLAAQPPPPVPPRRAMNASVPEATSSDTAFDLVYGQLSNLCYLVWQRRKKGTLQDSESARLREMAGHLLRMIKTVAPAECVAIEAQTALARQALERMKNLGQDDRYLQKEHDALRARARYLSKIEKVMPSRIDWHFSADLWQREHEAVAQDAAREGELRREEALRRCTHALRTLHRALHLPEPPGKVFDHLVALLPGRPDMVLNDILKQLKKAGRTVAIARRASPCPVCGDGILRGNLIEQLVNGAWIHAACPKGLTLLPREASTLIERTRHLKVDQPADLPALPAGDGTGTELQGAADGGTITDRPGQSQETDSTRRGTDLRPRG